MIIIGICGGSGSGKTDFARTIKETFTGQVAVLSGDNWYKDLSHLNPEDRKKRNFDEPEAVDLKELYDTVEIIKDIQPDYYEVPTYCFRTQTRKAPKAIITTPVIIVETIFLLYHQQLRELCDYTVFIDAADSERLSRRLLRDITRNGYSPEKTAHIWRTKVRPSFDLYVKPYKFLADVVINSNYEEKNENKPFLHKQVRMITGWLREELRDVKEKEETLVSLTGVNYN